jgi:uncharacterized damage-inducible protein DinB
MKIISKPQEGEYAPYTLMYIGLFPDDGLILQHLTDNLQMVKDLFGRLSEAKLTERFAEGEWNIKEILTHVIDDERIYAYRALRFARNDPTELPGFDQEAYVIESNANARTIEDILDEYDAVRRATITLFESFDDAMFTRSGVANGHVMSVRAAVYHIAGHELHHINSMKQNYL